MVGAGSFQAKCLEEILRIPWISALQTTQSSSSLTTHVSARNPSTAASNHESRVLRTTIHRATGGNAPGIRAHSASVRPAGAGGMRPLRDSALPAGAARGTFRPRSRLRSGPCRARSHAAARPAPRASLLGPHVLAEPRPARSAGTSHARPDGLLVLHRHHSHPLSFRAGRRDSRSSPGTSRPSLLRPRTPTAIPSVHPLLT
jgi:hypothetical protein